MISSQFLQSCQSGDETAIQTLVRTYQRAVFQLALSVIDNAPLDEAPDAQKSGSGDNPAGSASAEAEAATRETFIIALDRLGRYREDTNFETWLYAIAIDVSRRRARGWRTRRALLGGLLRAWHGIFPPRARPPEVDPNLFFARPIPEAAPKAGAEPAHTNLPAGPRFHPGDPELWSSVRHLNEKLRVPVVLRYYHDYSVSDIAHLLRISEGTVHARLDAAREKIALHGMEREVKDPPEEKT
jgi:DNA-directed RNA polymerase specialized sigma24 family protein